MNDTKPKILVVDDETHILHVVSLKLKNAGFEVWTAEDGEDGFEQASQSPPDLVITDLQMPFVNGMELCEKLKSHETTREVPALMLTARGYALPAAALERTNIVEVFSKPFSPREVLDAVRRLVNRSDESSSAASDAA